MQSPLSFSNALGHGPADKRIDILRQIGQGGSISQAARAVGVSYKAAWQAVDTLTNLAGTPLVERAVGGAGGGGARLTPAGQQLLAAADAMAVARNDVLAQLQASATGDAAPAAAGLAVRTSMRNQWPCHVTALERHGALVLVHLAGSAPSAAALTLQARITRDSAQLLALRRGSPVLALCKATAVQVACAGDAAPAPNCWPGEARRVARGTAGDEVAAALDAGVQMVGFAAPGSGLRARARVQLSVEASAIVLAVAP